MKGFGILMNASETTNGKNQEMYSPQEVVSAILVLNVNDCLSYPIDLVDYRRVEIQPLIEWFRPLLHAAGCNINAVHDQWVSLNSRSLITRVQF